MSQPTFTLTAKRADGKPLEFAPGNTKYVCRGPLTKQAAIASFVNHFLPNFRRRHYEATIGLDGKGEDIGPFSDITCEQSEDAPEQTRETLGQWRPAGAQPIALPAAAEVE